MKIDKLMPLLLSAAVVSACGGGSDSDDNAVEVSPPPTTTSTVFGEFRFAATKCNYSEPNTDALIIVHGDDGAVLSEHTMDSDGRFELPWSSQTKHLTTIVKFDNQYRIKTNLDYTNADKGIHYTYSEALNSQCDCKSITVDISELSSNFPYHDIRLEGRLYNQPDDSLEVCRLSQASYPPVNLLLTPNNGLDEGAYAAMIDISPQDTHLNLTTSHIDAAENSGNPINYSLGSDLDYLITYANTAAGRKHVQSGYPGTHLYSFPELEQYSYLFSARWANLGDNDFGNIEYDTINRIRLNDPDAHYELTTPENEYQLLNEVESMFATADSSMSYNLENIEDRYQAVNLIINSSNMNWDIIGDLAGVIPDLQLPTTIENQLDQNVNKFTVGVFGYMQNQSIDNLRTQWAQDSRIEGALRATYFDNYTSEWVDININ